MNRTVRYNVWALLLVAIATWAVLMLTWMGDAEPGMPNCPKNIQQPTVRCAP